LSGSTLDGTTRGAARLLRTTARKRCAKRRTACDRFYRVANAGFGNFSLAYTPTRFRSYPVYARPDQAHYFSLAGARRAPSVFQGDYDMQWTTPQFTDLRFGFEITMYIANR